MKNFYFLLLLFCSLSALASTPVTFHSHKLYIEGVLPAPYHTLILNIELDSESDDVILFELFRGAEELPLPNDVLSKLKNIDLSTLQISHEMHRLDKNRPTYSQFGEEGDWLHISFALGERYRAEKEFEGVELFKWGKDQATITIIKNKTVSFSITPLVESEGYWAKKTW